MQNTTIKIGDVIHELWYAPEWVTKSGQKIPEHKKYNTLHNSKYGYDGEVKVHPISECPTELLNKL